MQRLEVSGAVRPIYGSLGVKRLIGKGNIVVLQEVMKCDFTRQLHTRDVNAYENNLRIHRVRFRVRR